LRALPAVSLSLAVRLIVARPRFLSAMVLALRALAESLSLKVALRPAAIRLLTGRSVKRLRTVRAAPAGAV
jgi:hypothetical protein